MQSRRTEIFKKVLIILLFVLFIYGVYIMLTCLCTRESTDYYNVDTTVERIEEQAGEVESAIEGSRRENQQAIQSINRVGDLVERSQESAGEITSSTRELGEIIKECRRVNSELGELLESIERANRQGEKAEIAE